jgi:methanogenic corrinoid protein MtbC1/DNA-binding Xre family transcriptional regulator
MADFASRLRELRVRRGLRQKDLARELGLAQTTIANYEQKSRFPDEEVLDRIADYFNTSLDYLLGRTDMSLNLQSQRLFGEGGPEPENPPAALEERAREYLQLTLSGRLEDAGQRVHRALRQGASLQEIYLKVFEPALKEAGRLWGEGKLDVAREHLLSENTLSLMSQLLGAARREGPPPGRHSCLCFAVCEEQHMIGVRMLSDLLHLEGWETRFLGGSLCTQHALKALSDRQPDLLALSATMPAHLGYVSDMIRAVRSASPLQRVRILVGGQAFGLDKDLWRAVGADGTAGDAGQAVEAARRLVDGSRS